MYTRSLRLLEGKASTRHSHDKAPVLFGIWTRHSHQGTGCTSTNCPLWCTCGKNICLHICISDNAGSKGRNLYVSFLTQSLSFVHTQTRLCDFIFIFSTGRYICTVKITQSNPYICGLMCFDREKQTSEAATLTKVYHYNTTRLMCQFTMRRRNKLCVSKIWNTTSEYKATALCWWC